MDLFSDLITAVQSDLTVGSESTLYDTTTIQRAINRAYDKVGAAFRWPATDDAKKTSSVINQEYYDYPQNWRPNTIWKLRVDGVDYGDPILIADYLYEKDNQFPTQLAHMWANQWNRYFIYPTPAVNGENNIEIWGQKATDALVNLTDTTIFSYSMRECNEALVLEAGAILRLKGQEEMQVPLRYIGGVYLLSFEAKQILSDSYAKIKQDDSKRQKTRPYFSVPDFFRTNKQPTKIGDFN